MREGNSGIAGIGNPVLTLSFSVHHMSHKLNSTKKKGQKHCLDVPVTTLI
jgi:hypothetical protein